MEIKWEAIDTILFYFVLFHLFNYDYFDCFFTQESVFGSSYSTKVSKHRVAFGIGYE